MDLIKKKVKPLLQTQVIYGPSITTDDMHNVQVEGAYDPTVYGEYANSWFKHYTLEVDAPAGWTFTGAPWVNLVSQDQNAREAFGWNNFAGAHDRFFIIQRGPNKIVCTCWAGSHPMIINLACTAVHP